MKPVVPGARVGAIAGQEATIPVPAGIALHPCAEMDPALQNVDQKVSTGDLGNAHPTEQPPHLTPGEPVTQGLSDGEVPLAGYPLHKAKSQREGNVDENCPRKPNRNQNKVKRKAMDEVSS